MIVRRHEWDVVGLSGALLRLRTYMHTPLFSTPCSSHAPATHTRARGESPLAAPPLRFRPRLPFLLRGTSSAKSFGVFLNMATVLAR